GRAALSVVGAHAHRRWQSSSARGRGEAPLSSAAGAHLESTAVTPAGGGGDQDLVDSLLRRPPQALIRAGGSQVLPVHKPAQLADAAGCLGLQRNGLLLGLDTRKQEGHLPAGRRDDDGGVT